MKLKFTQVPQAKQPKNEYQLVLTWSHGDADFEEKRTIEYDEREEFEKVFAATLACVCKNSEALKDIVDVPRDTTTDGQELCSLWNVDAFFYDQDGNKFKVTADKN